MLDLISAGKAKERLAAQGLQNKGEGTMQIQTDSESRALAGVYLSGVRLLNDSFAASSGKFNNRLTEKKDVPPALQKVLDQYDRMFGPQLRRESELLDSIRAKAGNTNIIDATVYADFETPHTIARIVLFEVYASDIIRNITDFGTMDNDRDQVPITRWRREAGPNSPSFRPSVLQRSNLKVSELSAMPRGKLITEFFGIDAVARKLQATMSDEFLTRARRRPDISGVAIATQNLIDDVRRAIMQDIFFEQIRAAAVHGGSTFDVLDTTDGIASSFQVIGTTAANAVTIAPNDPRSPVVVELGLTAGTRTAVPELGTVVTGGGPGNAFFYTINHALATISFVDSNGAAQVPAGAANTIRVTGTRADAEVRFDLTLPGATTQQQHMLALLFEIANQKAAHGSGGISSAGYYDPDMLLTSAVTAEYMKQAVAYEQQSRRAGFTGDAVIMEGNYGVSAGLTHWGSKNFVDDFCVIGDSSGVLFRQYEPLNLRGPIEGRDSSGQLNGSKEWYAYQEDSIATPLVEKFSLVTLYRS
jgi:hypothetical protein